MNIVTATRIYERRLAEYITLVPSDLDQKHANMAANPFDCFRATYYRRSMRFRQLCKQLLKVTNVNAVRDIHVENYGTWRDNEARLVWGVNDCDEAYPGPFTEDLVQLGSSVVVGSEIGKLTISVKDACEALEIGYRKGLTNGPSPFVLSNKHAKLRRMAMSDLRDPVAYWQKMRQLPSAQSVPDAVAKLLSDAMPSPGLTCDFRTRQAGQGSLGRQRFVAIAEWKGGYVAREAKAWAPSAVALMADVKEPQNYYLQTVNEAARCEDPCLQLRDGWILRRLSPDCSRIELWQLAAAEDEYVLLKAMGRELANIHAADPETARKVLADLDRLPKNWLRKASEVMAADSDKNHRDWRRHYRAA